MTAVLEADGLRKAYRRLRGGTTVAVAGLDLAVPEGGVFGFLGPNGSGKTTTIRCLLGLVRPSAGRCRVLGADSTTALHQVVGRVGAIVETPTLFPSFSGRRNLLLLGRLAGVGPRRVEEVLELVALAEDARRPVKAYSLGMKQRLGLAAALLKDPAVLILDEPANGLDPAGIREVRLLLRRLGDEGRTVFVSSHILAEVQQTCDRVAILSRGRLVAAGSVADVLAAGRAGRLSVRVDRSPSEAERVLGAAGFECRALDDHVLVRVAREDAALVTRALADQGVWVTELRPEKRTLEDVFIELTGGPGEGPGGPGEGPGGPGEGLAAGPGGAGGQERVP